MILLTYQIIRSDNRVHFFQRDTIVRALFFPCASHSCDLTLIFYGIKYDYSSWKATTWLTLNLKKRVYDVWYDCLVIAFWNAIQQSLLRTSGGNTCNCI
ncbi:hypothetical protein Y032_0083g1644 [Ancylostoma ceylanicum]|uniref:Uncharacterized protein n=1 Tax=Ancylostoma ceylanicum TaxID=53326 RepID=A0A016TR04_9BILA|nr:hypothetical protein Y032_0083g1644 [Ancylostoma ceylanicum]